jgi:hypothetical protein
MIEQTNSPVQIAAASLLFSMLLASCWLLLLAAADIWCIRAVPRLLRERERGAGEGHDDSGTTQRAPTL